MKYPAEVSAFYTPLQRIGRNSYTRSQAEITGRITGFILVAERAFYIDGDIHGPRSESGYP